MLINDIKYYNFSSYLYKFKLKIIGFIMIDIFCLLNIIVYFFIWFKFIDVFNCWFFSMVRYLWIKCVCLDIFWKVDVLFFFVWISIFRDVFVGIIVNSGFFVVVIFVGFWCVIGFVYFIDILFWMFVLK